MQWSELNLIKIPCKVLLLKFHKSSLDLSPSFTSCLSGSSSAGWWKSRARRVEQRAAERLSHRQPATKIRRPGFVVGHEAFAIHDSQLVWIADMSSMDGRVRKVLGLELNWWLKIKEEHENLPMMDVKGWPAQKHQPPWCFLRINFVTTPLCDI